MQKKESIKPTSGEGEKVFEVTPSRVLENAFLFIQSYTKSYYIVYWRRQPTHQRRKRPCTGGQTLLFAATGGKSKGTGWVTAPHGLYVKRGHDNL